MPFRVIRVLAATCALVVWLLPGPALADGVAMQSKDGRFSITLPAGSAIPEPLVQTAQSDMGPMRITMYMADTETTQVDASIVRDTYIVGFTDYPKDKLTRVLMAKALQNARDVALHAINAKLDSEAPYRYEGFQGLSLRFTVPSNGSQKEITGHVNLLLVHGRLYQVFFCTDNRANIDSANATQFFGSFRLTR